MELHEAQKLGLKLMAKHGVKDYILTFMHPKKSWRRAGSCNVGRKEIRLQPTFVLKNSVERVTQTIIHEIAHALTPGEGHSKVWKEKAKQLGHSGERLYSAGDTIK